MDNIHAFRRVKREDVVDVIREIAELESDKVFMATHAELRMFEREITLNQVIRTLQFGDVIEGPEWDTKIDAGWKVLMRHVTAGEYVSVAAKLIDCVDDTVCVITVY